YPRPRRTGHISKVKAMALQVGGPERMTCAAPVADPAVMLHMMTEAESMAWSSLVRIPIGRSVAVLVFMPLASEEQRESRSPGARQPVTRPWSTGLLSRGREP